MVSVLSGALPLLGIKKKTIDMKSKDAVAYLFFTLL